MKMIIPELALVVLVGASGSGKSTFARQHFKPTEVLSSDFCRGLVSDDENSQEATKDAFEILHFIASKRLAAGKLTVIDATNVQPESRKPLVQLARQYHCLPVAIVFKLPEKICQERNQQRSDRNFGAHVIPQQYQALRRSVSSLDREGFRHIFVMSTPEEVDTSFIERQPLWNNLKNEHGPFDIIGDVHGCCDELEELLEKLGYRRNESDVYFHPDQRKAVFVGDLVDRGPRILDTLNLVRTMTGAGTALCVPGNHDMKLMRKLRGSKVQETHGLQQTLDELNAMPPEERQALSQNLIEFLDGLVSHYVLDDGKLVVAHAGMKQEMQGRGSGKVREFALYGETTGETDEFGLPVRFNWAAEYRGQAMVVYGHTPVPEPEWLNRTINIDTGCVFGGKLTALRYPERELFSVPARYTYAQPARPFISVHQQAAVSSQHQHDDLLDISDVLGKRIISTRLHHTITIREENASAALEIMSRFAANPKWLIYLPPTMSPSETSQQPNLLEHPLEAFAYYRNQGIPTVVCQQKHMGSRAVVVICRNEDAARQRFGVINEGIGICYTRTGRRFFNDASFEQSWLLRFKDALDQLGFWDEFKTDWACFDCELMPWSAKAQELIRAQYAAVGAASRSALAEVLSVFSGIESKPDDVNALYQYHQARYEAAGRYVDAYRRYCWLVHSIDDYRLAPFHLLATEAAVHTDKNHEWHITLITRLCHTAPGFFQKTPYQKVDVTDAGSQNEAIAWWTDLTGQGGEGVVVKPLDFIVTGRRGLIQPAIKCRGPEYLRIIYGPEYLFPEYLEQLKIRGLNAKRSLALREFALGIESLERFVQREPLRRVHECVFGVLALESDPVDPRL